MKSLDTTALVMMLIIGAIAGWLAGVIVGHPKWGLLGSIVAGIIGGVVGGWLLNVAKVNIDVGHPIANSVITGAIGAVVVIVLARLLS
ncbi:MAG: GlsB/YeaQ/YmgE family stress response membrane protein [Hyphomicrobiaceae bacterium]